MNKKMNKKLNNQKKKLFLFIGIAVIVVIVLAIVFFVALGGKKNDNGGSTGQTVLFDDAYNNTVNATNYKIQFTISKDDSSLVLLVISMILIKRLQSRKRHQMSHYLADILSIMRI